MNLNDRENECGQEAIQLPEELGNELSQFVGNDKDVFVSYHNNPELMSKLMRVLSEQFLNVTSNEK